MPDAAQRLAISSSRFLPRPRPNPHRPRPLRPHPSLRVPPFPPFLLFPLPRRRRRTNPPVGRSCRDRAPPRYPDRFPRYHRRDTRSRSVRNPHRPKARESFHFRRCSRTTGPRRARILWPPAAILTAVIKGRMGRSDIRAGNAVRQSPSCPTIPAVLMSAGKTTPPATPLALARRVVVKVGSSLLVDGRTGRLNRGWVETLSEDLLRLHRRGQQVILVSSGAIALGRRQLRLPPGPLRLEESQAAAAVGQIRLAHAYKELLEEGGVTVAQVLLTLEDSEQRTRYLNARATLEALLSMNAIPVINENDTVATAEIRYGDNDRLAARVAQMASADCLVLLSDVDGLYTADPTLEPSAQFIEQVLHITPEIEAMAGGSRSGLGSGGMATKILAAKIAVSAGCHLCIAAGQPEHPVRRIEEGARCTWFVPNSTPAAARKQWIAGSLQPAGSIMMDAGAIKALQEGKSLLPAGVLGSQGRFDRGDTVSVVGPDGREFARGICAYSDADASRIMGRRSSEIEAILGFRGREELIHRDDLVILQHDYRPPEHQRVPSGAPENLAE